MDKYLDLARELKKLWNMKVIILPIIVGTLEQFQNPGKETRWNWKSEKEYNPSRPQNC